MLLALLQDDAKNQSSYLTWGERMQREKVAAFLRQDFLVTEERADKLSGAWGQHPLLGRCIFRLIGQERSESHNCDASTRRIAFYRQSTAALGWLIL